MAARAARRALPVAALNEQPGRHGGARVEGRRRHGRRHGHGEGGLHGGLRGVVAAELQVRVDHVVAGMLRLARILARGSAAANARVLLATDCFPCADAGKDVRRHVLRVRRVRRDLGVGQRRGQALGWRSAARRKLWIR